ncbi:MAG: GGDEF domain-containing protein [Firmicutes bacterium]|nr:GGDEF domain-containing protein [Bacillota bacterium]
MSETLHTASRPVAKGRAMQPFVKRVSTTFAALLVIGAFSVFILIYLPLNKALEKSLINNFRHLSSASYQTLQNDIFKCVESGKVLSTRIALKNAILNYKNEEIGIEELALFSQSKYEEALQGVGGLISANRFVDDIPIAKVSQSKVSLDEWDMSDIMFDKNKAADSNILLKDNRIYCIVKSVIVHDSKRIGHDMLVFDLTEDVNLLSGNVFDVSIINAAAYKTLINDSKIYQNFDGMLLLGMPDSFYVSIPINENAYFVAEQSKKQMFSMVNHLGTQACIVFACILLAYIIMVHLNIVQFAKKELKKLEITNAALGKAASEANVDSLTKAGSRRYGTEFFEKVFSDFKIGAPSPIIIMFDIDLFKQINDSYGHYTGDRVLKKVVAAIRKTIRNEDKLFRWGGDEFVGVFFGIKKENAGFFANKMLNTVLDLEIELDGKKIRPTVSIGISYFKSTDTDFYEAINRADRAMYLSKAGPERKVNIL